MAWSNDQMKKTHQCWADMKQRCYNKNSQQYSNYGERGIVVCDRWFSSFENFVSDMGVKPDGFSLDRINVDGNYEPANCRWADKYQQQRNRRNNVLIEFNGQKMTVREWSKVVNLHESTLSYRLKQGWPIDMVVSKNHFDKHWVSKELAARKEQA